MNNQVLGWGVSHFFATTPKWASRTVGVLLALTSAYSGFILQFPDVVPMAYQSKIGAVMAFLTLFFQGYGLKESGKESGSEGSASNSASTEVVPTSTEVTADNPVNISINAGKAIVGIPDNLSTDVFNNTLIRVLKSVPTENVSIVSPNIKSDDMSWKLFANAGKIVQKLEADLPGLVTKSEKLVLLNEGEKLLDSCGLGIFVDGKIEQLKAEVAALPDA